MKTTLDLPDALFRQVKARAAMEGLKLKELISRYVERGLASADEPARAIVKRQPTALDLLGDGQGLVKSGLKDLATNPKHMRGFGRE